MTKEEAIELENKFDKLMSEALGGDCKCCMTLSGNLQIIIENNCYITLDKYCDYNVDYVVFKGDYWRLQEYVKNIKKCINKNKDLLIKLLASYNVWSKDND